MMGGGCVHNSGMDESWADRLAKWRDTPGAMVEQGKKGIDFLRSRIGSLPFFAATSVDVAEGNPERDEMHYFLIPDPGAEGGYDLAERRRLPEGVGTVNSLPKVRVFHFHDKAGVAVLEEKLLGRLAAKRSAENRQDSDLAERMEILGEEIDRKSHWLTGGLIVVGGVVAVANPLLGVGIAVQALVPELGGKLTKFGLGAAAEKLRRFGANRREEAARRKAAADVRAMEPEMIKDVVLCFLDEMASLGPKADPVMAELARLPEWWLDRDQRFTMRVVSEVLHHSEWEEWLTSVSERMALVE